MLNDMSITIKISPSRAFDLDFFTKVEGYLKKTFLSSQKKHFSLFCGLNCGLILKLILTLNVTYAHTTSPTSSTQDYNHTQTESKKESLKKSLLDPAIDSSVEISNPSYNSQWQPSYPILYNKAMLLGAGIKNGIMDIEKNNESTYYLNIQMQKIFMNQVYTHPQDGGFFSSYFRDYGLDAQVHLYLNGLISAQFAILQPKESDGLNNWLPRFYYFKYGLGPIIHTSSFLGGFIDYQRYFASVGVGASHFKWLPKFLQTEATFSYGLLGWNFGVQLNYLWAESSLIP